MGDAVSSRREICHWRLPNQHPGGAGLPEWTQANRSIENTDVVVWYTIGMHHIPRPEEWPVMPVSSLGFSLKPLGFFDRNPALDVPPPVSGHCQDCVPPGNHHVHGS